MMNKKGGECRSDRPRPLSMLGVELLIAHFGAGPLSIDQGK
jgi:hypothetical protein